MFRSVVYDDDGNDSEAVSNLINVTINNQQLTVVENNSFPSGNPNSTITFYNTESNSSLTGNWPTIAGYYTTKIYNSGDNPLCFNEGTLILCLNSRLEEEYIPIENLRKGDLVKSYKHGYRKIDLIRKNHFMNNPDNFSKCMYKMEKTETNGLIDDLIVTGWHSILVDDLKECKEANDKVFGGKTQLIDDKYLLLACVSKDFSKIENTELYTYYHFVLENNNDNEERFGVWANGVLTETPPKNHFIEKF